MILQKEWKWEACPGFHAVYTAVLILGGITGRGQEGRLSEKMRVCCLLRNTESFKIMEELIRECVVVARNIRPKTVP